MGDVPTCSCLVGVVVNKLILPPVCRLIVFIIVRADVYSDSGKLKEKHTFNLTANEMRQLNSLATVMHFIQEKYTGWVIYVQGKQ